MAATWKPWEGRTIKGEFPLQHFLGGSESHAVFLCGKSAGGRPQTAFRVLDANTPGASDQFRQWQAVAKLQHPNLVRIFESGRCEVDGKEFFYAWTEYGEEDLAQILPTRALSLEETRQILDAVLPALSYLHGQGLVHGRVKPSNVFAVGDTVKLSSDTAGPSGRSRVLTDAKSAYDAPEAEQGVAPSTDVWSLGTTLAEALTQKLPVLDARSHGQPALPDGISQPFKNIIENCLQVDPAKRWTAAQIQSRLKAAPDAASRTVAAPLPAERKATAPAPKVPSPKQSAKWVYVIAVALAVVIAVIFISQRQPSHGPSETQSVPAQPESSPGPAKPSANLPERTGSKSNAAPPASSQIASSNPGNTDGMLTLDSRDDVLQRVAPRISPSARRTITGMIRLRVHLNVDAAGNVTEARLQSAGPSKYFARVAEEAAREWKFKPATVNGQAVPSKWNLHFGFSRRSTEAAAERVSP